jgi:hypothetical protein
MTVPILRHLVLVFALLNGAIYACFLPLWEGFDEPFHYGYVQSLSAGRIPVLGRTNLSDEIEQSFRDVPLSRFLSGATGGLSFEEWFTLPLDRRREIISAAVDPALRDRSSNFNNYEAQQAPLAYALLAPFDLALSREQLRWRILALRLIATLAAVLLLWFGVARLSRLLELPDTVALAAAACIFASQMLWATVAHVGNDYLAVPLTLLFLVHLGLAAKMASARELLILSVVLSLGLLTKAYFLAFVPVFVAMLLVRKRPLLLLIPTLLAAPWYIHNRLLYGSFSGTQQAVAGIGVRDALGAVTKISWLNSTAAFVHWSLWTGNWSFLSFSKTTLDMELVLIGAGIIFYFFKMRRLTSAEWWMMAACASFCAALVYQTCVTYIHTHGASLFAEPWYWQGIICFLWVIAFRGFAIVGKAGRVFAVAAVVLCAWICVITYVAKLFPGYGSGFERATLGRVWVWWTGYPTQELATVAMASPYILYGLLALLVAALLTVTAVLIQRLAIARA